MAKVKGHRDDLLALVSPDADQWGTQTFGWKLRNVLKSLDSHSLCSHPALKATGAIVCFHVVVFSMFRFFSCLVKQNQISCWTWRKQRDTESPTCSLLICTFIYRLLLFLVIVVKTGRWLMWEGEEPDWHVTLFIISSCCPHRCDLNTGVIWGCMYVYVKDF